jgi:hypothetical protein
MANVDGLYNELVCLCEVRGELSPEDNARIEERIAEIQKQINELENSNA